MPLSFTNEEVHLLKNLSKDYPTLSDKIQNIHPNVYYQSRAESVKEDVLSIITSDNYGEIDEATLNSIVLRVMKYDNSDYNEFINNSIREIVGDKHE